MPGTSSILPILAVPPRLIRKSAIMYAWEISSFDCFFSQLPKPLKPSFSQKKDMAIYKLADHISSVICSLIAFSSFFEIVMTIIVFRCFYIFFFFEGEPKGVKFRCLANRLIPSASTAKQEIYLSNSVQKSLLPARTPFACQNGTKQWTNTLAVPAYSGT